MHDKDTKLSIPPQLLPLALVLNQCQLRVNILSELGHEVHQCRTGIVDFVHDQHASAEETTVLDQFTELLDQCWTSLPGEVVYASWSLRGRASASRP